MIGGRMENQEDQNIKQQRFSSLHETLQMYIQTKRELRDKRENEGKRRINSRI